MLRREATMKRIALGLLATMMFTSSVAPAANPTGFTPINDLGPNLYLNQY